jgi:ribonucleoside-triphosphate reductase
LNFIGKDLTTNEGRKFAGGVLDYMRDRMVAYQKETGSLYNLEATPAEGTSYRLARVDKKKYPDIIVANEKQVRKGAEPFYTNSSQLPVDYTRDLFKALKLQDDLQCKYTGGTVFHAFLGERLPSGREVRVLAKKIVENFGLPYFSFTPTFSVCPIHGYLKGEWEFCPKCDREIGYKERR